MYNPFPYDDPKPVNRPRLEERTEKALVKGSVKVFSHLAAKAAALEKPAVIALDGYVAADFARAANLLQQQLRVRGLKSRLIDFRECLRSEEE